MKRYIKSSKSAITINLDYPDEGQLHLTKTGSQRSCNYFGNIIWRDEYIADDGSYWMKIDKCWTEVVDLGGCGYVRGERKSDLRKSQEEKDEERKMYERIKNGGFNPLDGI